MPALAIAPLTLASRLLGISEVPGDRDNPHIVAWLDFVMREMGLTQLPVLHDEIPNCSAFVGYVCGILDLPRPSRHADAAVRRLALRARAWLTVGAPVPLEQLQPGYDVCVFNRGGPVDPGVLNAPGHVGFPIGRDEAGWVQLLGANQGNTVSIGRYPATELLGIRRLYTV